MFRLIKKLWKIAERRPIFPDVIVPLEYGATENFALADASISAIRDAVISSQEFPHAIIAFVNATHLFPNSAAVELEAKESLFTELSIPPERVVYAGGCDNSVKEAICVREALERREIYPREILLISDELHGRSVMYVWSRVFTDVRISLAYTDSAAYQSDAVLLLLRSKWLWLLANIARQIALRIFGMRFVSNVHHPSKI